MTTPATSLGAFSISLAVKDLAASRDFYRKLGFEPAGGNLSQNWLILRNGSATIGLFCGMFERNLLTFNPGWDAQCAALEQFTDVREIQRQLEADGVTIDLAYGNATTDIHGYKGAGIAAGQQWIIGPNAGAEGTHAVSSSWAARTSQVSSGARVSQPF